MEVIEELIKLAKELDAATKRGEDLGLTDDEVAFYDALAANDCAVQAMGDDKLKVIAAELITQVRKSVTIDWTLRESARAKIKVMVKRILNKHGYPPDLEGGREDRARAGGAAVRGVGGLSCRPFLRSCVPKSASASAKKRFPCSRFPARRAVMNLINQPCFSRNERRSHTDR